MTYVERYPNELYHHGIKGQKWGRRRFQDSSGKLTAAGKKRYKEYNKDYKEYKTLNRHVSAAQRHLKEEGIMLDRVRDKYQQADRAYRKEMMKSNGLFGLKAARKADKVARAQNAMDTIGKDYDAAANSYGYANRIAKKDRKALTDHVDKMLSKYGKGSVKEVEYETVKIGQNKLQKIMQGAPVSSLFGRERETDQFVKTGKTVADMPVIGNWYTANYTSNQEWNMKRSEVEKTRNSNSAKRKTGKDKPGYLKSDDYFDGVSSASAGYAKRKQAAAEKKKKEKQAAAEKKKKEKEDKAFDKKYNSDTKKRLAAVTKATKKDLKKATRTSEKKAKDAEKEHKKRVKQIRRDATRAYDEAQKEHEDNIRRGSNTKKYIRWMGHSAFSEVHYSDELYHHGVKGQKWGVRRYQNTDGSLTTVGKKHYSEKVKYLSNGNLEIGKNVYVSSTYESGDTSYRLKGKSFPTYQVSIGKDNPDPDTMLKANKVINDFSSIHEPECRKAAVDNLYDRYKNEWLPEGKTKEQFSKDLKLVFVDYMAPSGSRDDPTMLVSFHPWDESGDLLGGHDVEVEYYPNKKKAAYVSLQG